MISASAHVDWLRELALSKVCFRGTHEVLKPLHCSAAWLRTESYEYGTDCHLENTVDP
jgi:hypothetical protein